MDANQIKNNQYFKTLPTMIQESILMSGVTFNNEDDLHKFVDNLNTQPSQ